jgi:hypothetical protein
MSRLDDLRLLEADLVVLQPRACGCLHELISSATGIVQFCAVAAQARNTACFHRPNPDDLRSAINRAIQLQLLSSREVNDFLRDDQNIYRALADLDREAQLVSEELEEGGELIGINDFADHWLTLDIRERQQSHVDDLRYMIDTILLRVRKAIAHECMGTENVAA